MRVANSRSSNAGALNMSATDAAKMRGASAATGMAASASASAATGGGRLGVGDQQHTDRNDRSENAAFASHKDEPPMANVQK
jgi:hypothetical protein